MTSKLLSLDLSTTCTGWSTFDLETKELLNYGILKPKVKGITKLIYPERQLRVGVNLSLQILELIMQEKPTKIVIEEINRHKNRMAGKTLDILHGFVWQAIDTVNMLPYVTYMDSDGTSGWRSRKCLNLIMSDADRLHNKEAKKLNKKLDRGQKIPIITKKHLAQRYVNAKYGTTFDVDKVKTDADVCDSIGLGHAFLHMYIGL